MTHPHRRTTLAAALLPALSILVLAAHPPAALGQSADRPSGPAYGTTSRILYHVGFDEFAPEASMYNYSTVSVNTHLGRISNGPVFFSASPHIPSGALLTYLELDYCDINNGGQHMDLLLSSCDFLGADCLPLGEITTAALSGDGCGFIPLDLTPQNFTLDNNARELVLRLGMSSGNVTNVLIGAYVGYKLQVSAGPAVATFTDVPTTSPLFKFVEALVAAGITAGCGGGNYCPNTPITRGQMAVFLATALGLHFPN